jgi:hypothetical protein
MRNNNPRRDGIAAGAAGKVEATEFTSPLLPDQAHPDADDLRVERIAAQLEEAEQKLLSDYWRAGLGIVEDDTAPPLAPNAPDEGDDGGQALMRWLGTPLRRHE